MGCLATVCQYLCLALFFLNAQPALFSPPICSDQDGVALIRFKNSFSINKAASNECQNLGIKSYPKTNLWKEGTDCCLWDGVTCDNITGQVIGLDLSCSWLSGILDSNSSLFLLPSVQKLNLAHNDFEKSSISSKFGLFTSLTYLNLSMSAFSGKVPLQISYLSKLVSLDLSSNDSLTLDKHTFNGILQNLTQVRELFLDDLHMSSISPSSLMNMTSSLTSISLSDCDLRGNFPMTFFHLPNLKLLDLRKNKNLIVHLPESNWSVPLRYLSLLGTSTSGKLPNSIGNLKSLKHLQLALCNFSGPIPGSLGNLSELTYLELSRNHFSGQIPSSLTYLAQLKFLYIFDNLLEGPLPAQVSVFPNLIELDLSSNLLNQTTPPWFYTTPSLKVLTIHDNQLTGHIKEFQHKSLTWISLGNNEIQGQIPKSLFGLENLTDLDLSSNSLSGVLDLDALVKLQNLEWLDLSYNSLSFMNSNISATYSLPNLKILYLPSFNMGEFPNVLRGSTNLEALDLSNNRINGQMPKWMWDIGRDSLIYLNLSYNFLTDLEQIPWKNIRILDLSFNMIDGNLPNLPTNLIFLSISNNGITGEVSSCICNLRSLRVLDLSHNELSGNIPQCVGNFSEALSVLNLERNNFHGKIPTMLAKRCGLKNINLNGNQLEGPLSQSLMNCRKIKVLDFGNNKINSTFPHWLETLPLLEVLILRSNKLHGFISNPKTNHSFPKLRILDLSNNEFEGSLPAKYIKNFEAVKNLNGGPGTVQYMQETKHCEYFVNLTIKSKDMELKISTRLTSIDLSLNKFDGAIPAVIGELVSLIGLNLSHNNLDGHIPPSMGNLINLEWLDLSSNKLTGEIPKELENLTFLSFIDLSHNQLEGPIPSGRQFNTFENVSYEGNLGLCGFPLSKACNNEVLQPPSSMTFHGDSKHTSDFGWKVVLMGYGCGMAFGLSMGYVVFKTGKPKWLVKLVDSFTKHRKVKWSKERTS